MSSVQSPSCTDANCIVKFLHFTANLFQLCSGCFQMLGNYIFYCNVSACSSRRKHKGSCLDLIRNNRIFCAVKLLHTFYADNVCSGALNVSSHAVQEVSYINYMRLSGRIFDNRASRSHRCCHHNVDGCANRHNIQENMASVKIFRTCHNRPMKNLYICSQSPEALQMLVNGTASDIASARKRHLRMFIFSKQRAQKIIGCADFFNVFIINADIGNGRTINLYCRSVDSFYLGSDPGNCFQQNIDVSYVRQIFD